jgi:hypothetical protein
MAPSEEFKQAIGEGERSSSKWTCSVAVVGSFRIVNSLVGSCASRGAGGAHRAGVLTRFGDTVLDYGAPRCNKGHKAVDCRSGDRSACSE